MTALPAELAKLSIEEKRELIELLWESIDLTESDQSFTTEQRQEIERRIAEDRLNPDNGRPWEEVKANLLKRRP